MDVLKDTSKIDSAHQQLSRGLFQVTQGTLGLHGINRLADATAAATQNKELHLNNYAPKQLPGEVHVEAL